MARELKFFDTVLSFAFDTTAEIPATGQLVLIPQGAGSSDRIGRKVTIASVQLRAGVFNNPGGAATANIVSFLYLVLDTQCNGAAAAVTDVFTGTNLATALPDLDNRDRFVILKEWSWEFNPSAGVAGAWTAMSTRFDTTIECEIPLVYSGASGALTEITSNNLFLVAGSDSGGDDTMQLTGRCRVRYFD